MDSNISEVTFSAHDNEMEDYEKGKPKLHFASWVFILKRAVLRMANWEWHSKIAKWSLILKKGNTNMSTELSQILHCFSHAYFYPKYYEVVFNYWKCYYCSHPVEQVVGQRGENFSDFRRQYSFVILSESKQAISEIWHQHSSGRLSLPSQRKS